MTPTQFYRHDVLRETDKAVCIGVNRTSGIHIRNGVRQERTSEVWLPKSRIEWRDTVYGAQLFAPAWLTRKL